MRDASGGGIFRTEDDEGAMKVYLSGEIHTDWRDQIVDGAKGLDVTFSSPVTDHAASDDCGVLQRRTLSLCGSGISTSNGMPHLMPDMQPPWASL